LRGQEKRVTLYYKKKIVAEGEVGGRRKDSRGGGIRTVRKGMMNVFYPGDRTGIGVKNEPYSTGVSMQGNRQIT